MIVADYRFLKVGDMQNLICYLKNKPFKTDDEFNENEINRLREICIQLDEDEFDVYLESSIGNAPALTELYLTFKELTKLYMFFSSSELMLKGIPPFSSGAQMALPTFYMNTSMTSKISYMFKTIVHVVNDRGSVDSVQDGRYLSDKIFEGRLADLHYRNNASKKFESDNHGEIFEALFKTLEDGFGSSPTSFLNPPSHYDKILDEMIDSYISDFCISRRFASFPMRMGLSHQSVKLSMHSSSGKRDFSYEGKTIIGSQLQGIVNDMSRPLLVCVLDQWEDKLKELELQERNIEVGKNAYQIEDYKGISVYAFHGDTEEEVTRDLLFFKSKKTKARDEHWQAFTHILSRLALNPNTHDLRIDCNYLPEVLSKRDNSKSYFDQIFGPHGYFQRIGAFMESGKATSLINSKISEERRSQKFSVRMPVNILFVYSSHLYRVPTNF